MIDPPTPSRFTNITHQYDDGELQPADRRATIPWDDALTQLATGGTFWLTTVDTDQRPHTRPVFAVVTEGVLFTASSSTAVKTAALRARRPVTLATSTDGLDVIWTGTPTQVTDPSLLGEVVDSYQQTYGWQGGVDDGSLVAPYAAPTAGPPPYEVFRIDPIIVHSVGTDSAFAGRSTRWDFPPTNDTTHPGPVIVAGHLAVEPTNATSTSEPVSRSSTLPAPLTAASTSQSAPISSNPAASTSTNAGATDRPCTPSDNRVLTPTKRPCSPPSTSTNTTSTADRTEPATRGVARPQHPGRQPPSRANR